MQARHYLPPIPDLEKINNRAAFAIEREARRCIEATVKHETENPNSGPILVPSFKPLVVAADKFWEFWLKCRRASQEARNAVEGAAADLDTGESRPLERPSHKLLEAISAAEGSTNWFRACGWDPFKWPAEVPAEMRTHARSLEAWFKRLWPMAQAAANPPAAANVADTRSSGMPSSALDTGQVGSDSAPTLRRVRDRVRTLARTHAWFAAAMRDAFKSFLALNERHSREKQTQYERKRQLARNLLSRGLLRDPSTRENSRSLFVRIEGLCPASLAKRLEQPRRGEAKTKKLEREAAAAALDALERDVKYQARDLSDDKRQAMAAEYRAAQAAKTHVSYVWRVAVSQPSNWQEPADPRSLDRADLERFTASDYLTIALYRLGGLADFGALRFIVPRPTNTGDTERDVGAYEAWIARFPGRWAPDAGQNPFNGSWIAAPALDANDFPSPLAEQLLEDVEAWATSEATARGESVAANGLNLSNNSMQSTKTDGVRDERDQAPERLRLLADEITVEIKADPAEYAEPAKWFLELPLPPVSAAREMEANGSVDENAALPNLSEEEASTRVGPTFRRLMAAWQAATERFSRRTNDRFYDLSMTDAKRIVLLTALTYNIDFDGRELGLPAMPWTTNPMRRLDGRGPVWAGVSAWSEQTHLELINKSILKIRVANTSRGGRDHAKPPANLAEKRSMVDETEYRPASWFPKGMAARLRMAARKSRRTKRVDSRRIDGVVCYSVADARRWWPADVPKDA